MSSIKDASSPGADRPVTIVLAEDNSLLAEGLTHTLARFRFEVVESVSSASALIEAVRLSDPDLVLTDVRMPPTWTTEGLDAALAIRARDPDQPIVVLSQYVHGDGAEDLVSHAGAGVGYLLKDRVGDVQALAASLRAVLGGATIIDPEVVETLMRRGRGPLGALSVRELETLEHMAQGWSNAAIAERMYVSEATVAKHIRSLFDKLSLPPDDADLHRRVRAVITYLQSQP